MDDENTLINRYHLHKKLGAGGFGTVFQATDLILKREVAVKILKTDSTSPLDLDERFMEEARIHSSLKHPHTLKIYDFGRTDDGGAFIVSELLTGAPLSALIIDGAIIGNEQWVISYFLPLCMALHEAHTQGVIHRDLKSENLFLHHDGHTERLMLIDFGIAKSSQAQTQTQSGLFFGTPTYMAPEQIKSSSLVTPQSDLYSLGIILFECLTGKTPYQGDSLFDTFNQHINYEVPHVQSLAPHVSDHLDALIYCLMEKDPAARITSALDLYHSILTLSPEHLQLSATPLPSFIGSPQPQALKETENYPIQNALNSTGDDLKNSKRHLSIDHNIASPLPSEVEHIQPKTSIYRWAIATLTLCALIIIIYNITSATHTDPFELNTMTVEQSEPPTIKSTPSSESTTPKPTPPPTAPPPTAPASSSLSTTTPQLKPNIKNAPLKLADSPSSSSQTPPKAKRAQRTTRPVKKPRRKLKRRLRSLKKKTLKRENMTLESKQTSQPTQVPSPLPSASTPPSPQLKPVPPPPSPSAPKQNIQTSERASSKPGPLKSNTPEKKALPKKSSNQSPEPDPPKGGDAQVENPFLSF